MTNVIEQKDNEYKKVILILDQLITFQVLQELWFSPTGAQVFLPTMLQGVATKEVAPLVFDIKSLPMPKIFSAIVQVQAKKWKLEEDHWDVLHAHHGKDVMILPEIVDNSLAQELVKLSKKMVNLKVNVSIAKLALSQIVWREIVCHVVKVNLYR